MNYCLKTILLYFCVFSLQLRAETLFGPEFEFRSKNRGKADIACILSYPAFIGALAVEPEFSEEERKSFNDDPRSYFYILTPILTPLTAAICSHQVSKFQARRLAKAIEKKCEVLGCKVALANHQTSHLSKPKLVHRVEFPDGWYFNIDADITAVEISAKPLTEQGWRDKKEVLKKTLYETAEDIGLKVPIVDRLSGGHISIGYQSIFEGNPLLLRNFIVDQINHVELSTGVHLYDPFNAKPISFNTTAMNKLSKVLRDFDRGKIKDEEEFIRRVYKAIKDGYGHGHFYLSKG